MNSLEIAREKARRLNREAAVLIARELERTEIATDPELAKEWFQAVLGGRTQEAFAFLFVDQGRRVVGQWVMPEGSRTRTVVYPRQVAKRALECDATGFYIAHNHPGDSPIPSAADRELTRRMQVTFDALEITLIDHFIVTTGKTTSFLESGWL